MNNELQSLAKQFRISVLSGGKFKASDGLNNEEYLLELFRAEAKARIERAEAERINVRYSALPARATVWHTARNSSNLVNITRILEGR